MFGVRFASWAVVCLAIAAAAGDAAGAVQSYLNIPSIAGVDGVPGYAGAMSIPSLTIMPHTLTVTKALDAASPAIFLATAQGTPTGTVSTLIYNGAPGAKPDAKLDFFNTLIASYQQINGTTEQFSFNAVNPLELYLEVPGIPGESNTPGHAGVMRINSFTLTGNNFTIEKLEDSASDDLFLANAQGVQFASARLLLYDALPLGNEPDAVLEFEDLLITSSQGLGGRVPLEQHTFSFDTVSQGVPEPGTAALLGLGAAAFGGVRRRGSSRR